MVALGNPLYAAPADIVCEARRLCQTHIGAARRVLRHFQANPALCRRFSATSWVEASLREVLCDTAVSDAVYWLSHAEDRELVHNAVNEGCRQARSEPGTALDEAAWEGLRAAILYRLVW